MKCRLNSLPSFRRGGGLLRLPVLFALLAFYIGTAPGTMLQAQSQEEELARKREEKAGNLKPNQVSDWEARIRRWEKAHLPARIFQKGFAGVRPLFGGMPSGSGTVLGIGYIRGLESELVKGEINGRYSTLGYSQIDGRLETPTPQSRRPFRFYVTGKQYDYTQLNFFGLGPDSTEEKSFFRQRGYQAVSGLTVRAGGTLELGGEFGKMRLEALESGESPSAGTVHPGLQGLGDGKTSFNIWGASVRLMSIDTWDFPPVGWDLIVEGRRYDDQTAHRYTASQLVVQLRAHVPIVRRNRRIAFRLRTSQMAPEAGSTVPFYLMETLGGAGSLRGFDEYRFRDLRNVLMNLEYRWELWPYTDLAFFVDGGKVFSEFSDFNLKRLQWGYGGGIRVRAPGGISMNIDLAGSKEGIKLHIGRGVVF